MSNNNSDIRVVDFLNKSGSLSINDPNTSNNKSAIWSSTIDSKNENVIIKDTIDDDCSFVEIDIKNENNIIELKTPKTSKTPINADHLVNFDSIDADDEFNFGKCLKMKRGQRICGYALFGGFGSFMLIIGSIMISSTINNFIEFVILYSFGAIVMILGTFFLFGPIKQIKNSINSYCCCFPTIFLILIYLVLIVLTLVFAIVYNSKNQNLCVIFAIIQCATYMFYVHLVVPKNDNINVINFIIYDICC